VNRGAKFAATLKLFYPHADTLCGKDFDWLFDCPQTKQFLEWFCSMVSEENVLSPAEVGAYDALLAAGQPILEGDALEQALQTCCQVPPLPDIIPDDEGPSPEALLLENGSETRDYRERQLWWQHKLQVWAVNLQKLLNYLKEEEKVVKQDLRKAQMDLEVEVFQTSAVLSQISKAEKHLAEWYGDMGKRRPPVLLCEMDLGPYMELEQQATAVFERNSRQLLSMGDEEKDVRQEATERMDTKQTTVPESLGTDGDELLDDQNSFWKELSWVKKVHICAQREVIVMSAKVEALWSGSRGLWKLSRRTSLFCLSPVQQAVKAELQSQAAMFQMQLHALRCDITQIQTHQLPPLLKEQACLFCLPVLQRQLSLKTARLQNAARRQGGGAGVHSCLDLLELQLQRERKDLDQKAARLREMGTSMREARIRLQQQQNYFKYVSSSQKHPHTWIDTKELSALRLRDMLVEQDQKKQLFCNYEAIVAQCSQLVQDQKVLEAQLAAPISQLPALETSTKALCQLLYNSSNQLQLSPPEVTELMQQLTTMQDNLCPMLTDLLSDLKAKRRSLENPIMQTECNLYVYFYCNEDRLREVVEELEKQVSTSPK
ncbi:HAUS augmin-like complex subunit 3, partial [Tyto alba]